MKSLSGGRGGILEVGGWTVVVGTGGGGGASGMDLGDIEPSVC